MDKSCSDKSRKRQFCNVSSIWGLLVKSYSFVAVINQRLITIYYNDSHG